MTEPPAGWTLPHEANDRRLGRLQSDGLINFVARSPRGRLVLAFATLYVAGVMLLSVLVWILQRAGVPFVAHGSAPVTFLGVVYFNFTSALTVTFGDYVPVGFGHVLVIVEAFFSVGWFSIFAGVVVIKLMLLPDDSITFSKNAYYAVEEECFVIEFVNTRSAEMVHAQVSSFFRIGDYTSAHPGLVLPIVGNFIWRFPVEGPRLDRLKHLVIDPGRDTLRFSISASYRFVGYSNAVGYALQDVIVVDSRRALLGPDAEAVRDRLSQQSVAGLDSIPDGALNFVDYARTAGATILPG